MSTAAAMDGVLRGLYEPPPRHPLDRHVKVHYPPEWMARVRVEHGITLTPDGVPDTVVRGPLGRVAIPHSALLWSEWADAMRRVYLACYAVACADRGPVRVLHPPRIVRTPGDDE